MSFAHSPQIVTNGLVLALDAGNIKSYVSGSTTWFDKSGRGNNGTLINGPTFSSTNGGSIVFDGTNDGTDTNFNSALGDFTVCAWFKGINQGGTRRIVDKNFQTGFWLGYQGGNHPSSSYWGGGIRQTSPPYGIYIGPFPASTWNFISMRRQGTIQTLYANGIDNSISQSVTSDLLSTDGLTVGYGGGEYMSGNISIVQIYNRALSASEVQQNFNALRGRFGI